MYPDFCVEITHLKPSPDDLNNDYRPVLYRPDSTQVIPAYIRYLPDLAPQSSSELSRQISQRNIALVQRHIDAVGELDPKRILKCYGYRFGNKPFMIVALDGKESLSLLVGRGELNPVERLKLLCEAGKAIQYLHSRSPPVAHGAVHPRSIFVTRPDSAVLCDFALGKVWRLFESDAGVYGGGMACVQHTWLSPGARLGYTAPEYILEDTGEMLPPADIYAFASVILAVLSSRHPFTGVTMWSPKGIAAITQGVPPDPEDHPNLPEDNSLWPLLRRMWSYSPADRPTIDEVMKELDQELSATCPSLLDGREIAENEFGHPLGNERQD
ncbi:hypothetical protein M407DRAFT_34238 [Tulasnella calospora MUT 4182]|uniref:Protein kinase domain-containing protein n=1 Tax=Tulasnella calospora MUT 4182 TaxID=1051891 RepID=A0A0C3L308_9AGAM|nr:hypothetical protein M407DRAFT_34238 [Tulasnella calospora MUT 4182]